MVSVIIWEVRKGGRERGVTVKLQWWRAGPATCLGINLDPDDVQVISCLRISLTLLCA